MFVWYSLLENPLKYFASFPFSWSFCPLIISLCPLVYLWSYIRDLHFVRHMQCNNSLALLHSLMVSNSEKNY